MIVLVRHGETDLNSSADEGLRGWLDIPVNAEGMKIIANTAETLRKLPIYKIYGSDLTRAVQTAEEIGGVLRKEIYPHPAFRPWHVGELAGKPIKGVLPQFLDAIKHKDKVLPQGESFNTFLDRFLPAIKPLIAAKQLYCVVGHARNVDVVRALCAGKGKILNDDILAKPCSVEPGGVLLVRSDWTNETLNYRGDEWITRPKRAEKAAVLYIHKQNTQYQCKDCSLFIPSNDRCEIHGPSDTIRSYGGCGLFVKGHPQTSGARVPSGAVTKTESGYVESVVGFTCGRCEYFLPDREDCLKVDPESVGDDPGRISEFGCCNSWSPK